MTTFPASYHCRVVEIKLFALRMIDCKKYSCSQGVVDTVDDVKLTTPSFANSYTPEMEFSSPLLNNEVRGWADGTRACGMTPPTDRLTILSKKFRIVEKNQNWLFVR